MKKKIFISIVLTVFVFLGILVGTFYYKNLRGAWVAIQDSEEVTQTQDNTPATNTSSSPALTKNNTGIPLSLPDGTAINTLATVPGARVMTVDSMGNLWVSQTKQGQVTLVEIKEGKAIKTTAIFKKLKNPHGLAFNPDDPFELYIAEENKISKVRIYSEDTLHKIIDLPSGGRHTTRTIGFGPDKRLYVSIGSSCDTCREKDERRATIYSMEKDGTDFKPYAKGLRNTVFFTWKNNTMWGTEMGRDLLGDDLPPDEINIVQNEKNYGWPICYGQNIHDTKFDKNTYIRNPCMTPFETPSLYDLPAHSAPLGLAFIPDSGWPQDMQGDLLVAFHGSWNRTTPTGYKIVKLKIDYSQEQPKVVGMEDFISGWLGTNKKTYGRPVDILTLPNGIMYISDDKAGKIYAAELK
ncbi:MAG: PQQ-dependent sugar dehydrogenase [Candidatus Magasanikbacteria bacterium]|nr:PQQ-dependent sugar dehydrogenase [Candidatus Magasanikbacteria bacterium]